MQKMKKVLALLVSIVMCASLFVPVSFADGFSDVGADNAYYEAINYLASMGIINGFEDGTFFKPSESVTRAQFAKIMAYSLGHENIVASNQIFTDVPTNHWAAGNIEAMVSLGIINGMGDGTFAPENPVTYEQAVKMTVCALGYDQVAQYNGGYPDGYLKVATQRGFIKGIVDGVVGKGANRGLVAKLIDNMLGIDQLDFMTGEVIKDSSIKKESFSSETAKGQVIATYEAGLTAELEDECNRNEIIIRKGDKEVTYTIDGLSESVQAKISSYLGKLVSVNYKNDDGENTLTSIVEQKGKNKTLTIKSEDIYDFEDDSIEYYDEKSGDFEEANIANNYYIIYNGRTTEKTFSEIMTTLMAGDGTIELLSSDANNRYDVLFVKSYVTFVASDAARTLTSDDKKVIVYNKDDTTQKWELPKETGNRGTISYKLNGASGTYSSITKNSIVSIAASDDNTVFDVLVSTNKKSGANVTSLTKNEMIISLDGKEYKMSNLFKTFIDNNPNLVYAGARGEFKLDAFGKVAGMEAAAAVYTYGYLTSIETSTNSRADEPILMNIYAIGSGTPMQAQPYAFKDSFYVNGVKYKTSESSDIETVKAILERDAAAFVEDGKMIGTEITTENHGESQPVKFSVDGWTDKGEYMVIDKLFTHSGATVNDTSAVKTALVLNSKTDTIISSGSMSAGTPRTLGGYVINSDTKIIVVPQDKAGGTFHNRSYTSLGTGTTHYFQVFDATTTNVAGLLIIYTSPTTNVASLTHLNVPYIVSSTISSKIVNGESTKTISFTNGTDGTKTEYYETDETKVYTVKLEDGHYKKDEDVSFDSLAIGDIVRFIANDDNTLVEVEIVLKKDNVELHKRGINTASGTRNDYWPGVPYSTFTGTAKTWGDNHLVVAPAFVEDGALGHDATQEETWEVLGGVKVYLVDTAQSDSTKILTETSKEEIVAFDAVPSGASKIFGFRQNGTVKFIVIFK